jgi:endoglucanase
MSKAGVPSVALSVPCRYIHAPAAFMSLKDFEGALSLLKAALRALPGRWKSQSES